MKPLYEQILAAMRYCTMKSKRDGCRYKIVVTEYEGRKFLTSIRLRVRKIS